MKRTVLRYGLLAGAILVTAFLTLTMPLHDRMSPEQGMILGYTTMLMAFLLIFFGIRSYREKVGRGAVSFGRAFAIGALITLVASAMYVAAWQVIYFGGFADDFIPEYTEHVLEKARSEGASEAEIAAKRAEMEHYAELYQNPIINAGITLLEPLPVGLIMTLVSAGILRRRREDAVEGGAAHA